MTWRPWQTDTPVELCSYVQVARTKQLVTLPGPSDRSVTARARAIYDTLAQQNVLYAYELVTSEPGRQVIRSVDEVLQFPRHATCVDLAIVFSAASITAGLHPLIALLDVAGGRHAIVLLWDGSDSYPFDPQSATRTSEEISKLKVRPSLDGEGSFLAIDVSLFAPGYDRSILDRTIEKAVARGAELFGRSTQTTVVDVGNRWNERDELPPGAEWDRQSHPLIPPYDFSNLAEKSPSLLTRPEYPIVPFQGSDHLTFLESVVTAPNPGNSSTRVIVVHGEGGAGKTRLVAELANRLLGEGWVSGFSAGEASFSYLGRITSPLLVAVDYADFTPVDSMVNLLQKLEHSGGAPRCVVLIARSAGEWWENLERTVAKARLSIEPFVLDPVVAKPSLRQTVWEAALGAFAVLQKVERPNVALPRGGWTPLESVFLAWIAVFTTGPLPKTPDELYRSILEHEFAYWNREYRGDIKRVDWDTCAGILTLCAPRSRSEAVALLKQHRGELLGQAIPKIVATFADLWCPEWQKFEEQGQPFQNGLALRPDRLGDTLIRTLIQQRELGIAVLAGLPSEDWNSTEVGTQLRAVLNIARSATDLQADRAQISGFLGAATLANPNLAHALVPLATAGSNVAVDALAQLITDTTFADRIALARTLAFGSPLGHVGLRNIAAVASEIISREPTNDEAERAAQLNNLGIRLSEIGDRAGALIATHEAVNHYKQLATTNPNTFLPDLAMALNNLGARLSETGDRAGALTVTHEAVNHYKQLATTNPNTFLPDLASALNNLGNRLSETGDRAGALTATHEAVNHYKQLATTNPNAFLPDLAGALNNLGARLSATGDRAGALTATHEAVNHYKQLATTNPNTFLPNLASALNNLKRDGLPDGELDSLLPSFADDVLNDWLLAVFLRKALEDEDADARSLLRAAISRLTVDDPNSPHLGSARLAARSAFQISGEAITSPEEQSLPPWAWMNVEDRQSELAQRVSNFEPWSERKTSLADLRSALDDPPRAAQLDVLCHVFPEGNLRSIMTSVSALTDEEFADMISDGDENEANVVLAMDWFSNQSWADSRKFFDSHLEALQSPAFSDHLLSIFDDEENEDNLRISAQRHWGILQIAEQQGAGRAFAVTQDPNHAVDLVNGAIATGDLALIRSALAASPPLVEQPVGKLALAILRLQLEPEIEGETVTKVEESFAKATVTERGAASARLRKLATAQPSWVSSITKLIAAVNS
jgi:Tetratricopeptide repeat